MSAAYKVLIENLGDVRAELRLTQDDMAKAMDITRQTVASMEGGAKKDSRFVQRAFSNLKKAHKAKFSGFELVPADGQKEVLRISQVSVRPDADEQGGGVSKEAAANDQEVFDHDALAILKLKNRIWMSLADDDRFVAKNRTYLLELLDILEQALG